MFSKLEKSAPITPERAEELADVLLELGKDLFDRRHFDPAALWLERALAVLDSEDLDRLSEDAGDLRLSIMQKLGATATILKACGTNEAQ